VQAYREWDFSNMLTVLLRFNGRPVAAAVLRVFGQQLAELPLVATRPDARRQGHARVLVRAIEAMLTQLGVKVRLAWTTNPLSTIDHMGVGASVCSHDCLLALDCACSLCVVRQLP
jgi:N-acetylglutamate synthase-like GNAT family acetyltransferase